MNDQERAVLVITAQSKESLQANVRHFDDKAQVYQILPCVEGKTGADLSTLLVVSKMNDVQIRALEGTRQCRDLRTWSGVFTALYTDK